METKHDKFLRLATSRTNKLLETIKLLGNLSNKSNYEYSEEDVAKIFKAIDKEVKLAKASFESSGRSQNKFNL